MYAGFATGYMNRLTNTTQMALIWLASGNQSASD